MNTIVYRHLPEHEKANFRAKFLKHISLEILDERAEKRKRKRESLRKKMEEKHEKIQKKLELKASPRWMHKHKETLDDISERVLSFKLANSPLLRSRPITNNADSHMLGRSNLDEFSADNQTLLNLDVLSSDLSLVNGRI